MLAPKFITIDEFDNYWSANLREMLRTSANPSNQAELFLARVENRLMAYIDNNTFRRYEYEELQGKQLAAFKEAIILQAMYVYKNGDIGMDSGYDAERGSVINRANLVEISVCQDAIDVLSNAGLWNLAMKNKPRIGSCDTVVSSCGDTVTSGKYLKKDGTDAMEGELNMNSFRIFGLGDPLEDSDATNKKYVDSKLFNDKLKLSDTYLNKVSANTLVRPYLNGNGEYQEMVNNVFDSEKHSQYQKRTNFDGENDKCFIDTHLGSTSSIYTAATGDNSNININLLGNNTSIGATLNGNNSYIRSVLDGYSVINFYASGNDTNKSLDYCYLSSGYNGDDGIGSNNAPLLFFKKGGTANPNKYGLGFDAETHNLGYITKDDNTINWYDFDYLKKLTTQGLKIYAHSGASQFELDYDILATANSIAQRTASGNILMTDPVEDLAGVNKQYLENNYVPKSTTTGNYVYSHENDVQSEVEYSALCTNSSLVQRNAEGSISIKAVQFKNGTWLDVQESNGPLVYLRETQETDSNYALTTKSYVDTQIAKIDQFSYIVSTNAATTPLGIVWYDGETKVEGTLVASADTEFTIYLVPCKHTATEAQKGYDEYLTLKSNNVYSWEVLGNTADIDLSAYLKQTNDANTVLKINEIDNINGNALVRYKSTEGKNVFGGVGYNAVIMGASTRPYYSSDGSDFTGVELALLSDLSSYMKKVADSALDMQGNNINNVRNITTSGDALNIKSTDSSQDFTIDIWNSGSSEISDIKLSKKKGNTLKQLILELANDNVSLDIQTTDSNKNTYYADVVDVADDGSVDFINGAKSSVVPQNNNDLTNKEYVDTKIASSEKAVANGVATLDEYGKIPLEQIPSNLINYKVFTRRFYGSSMTGDLYIDGVKRDDIIANIGTDDGVKVRNDFDDMPFFGEINKVSLRAKDSDGNDLSDTNGTPIYDDFVFIPNYWFKVENGTDSSGNEYTDFSISTEEKTGYTRMKVNDDGSIPSHIGIGAYQSTYTLTSNSAYMCGCQKGQPICVNKNVDGYRNSYRYCLDYEHGIDTLTRIGSCSSQELDLPIIAMIIEFGNRNVQALFGGYLQGTYSGYGYIDATFKSYQSTEVCNYFIFPKASWTNFVNKGLGVGSFMSFHSYYADEYDRNSTNYWAKLTITAIEEYVVDEEVVGYKVSFDKTFTPSKNNMIGEFIAEEVGTTESIISSSGYKSNRNFGLRSFTYRGIENLWGGFRTLTDKLFLKCTYENGIKAKLDIVKSDGTSTTDNWQVYQANVLPFLNGTSTNQTGYTKVFDFKKGMLLPKELQSGGSTYYNTWFGCYNNTQTFFNIIRGGYWYFGSHCWGLFWYVAGAWSDSSYGYAVRPILYKNAS